MKEIELKIVISPQAHEILKRLVLYGLNGSTVEQVAERLLCDRLRECIQQGRK